MARPEKPIETEVESLRRFAADLRALRRRVPGLNYRAMAQREHYSTTVLSQAASGARLPTLEVTLAYVRACGGDTAEWTARWRGLDGELGVRAGENCEGPTDGSASGGVGPRVPALAAPQREVGPVGTAPVARPGAVDGRRRQRRTLCKSVVPAQLPPDVAGFVGRARLFDDLCKRITENDCVPAVVVLSGVGGAGKTTLAVHAGHCLREKFPDGQLFASLAGTGDHPVRPAEVLGEFLRALGVSPLRIPRTETARATLFRSLSATMRLLIVLDDARDAAQVRPLLPGVAGCAVVVISRSRLVALEATARLPVDVLSAGDSAALLSTYLDANRVVHDPDAVADLAAACGYLPLALRIAAGRLTLREGCSIRALADRTADEHSRLDGLRLEDLGVRECFTRTFRLLPASATRLVELWARTPRRVVTTAAAAAMLACSYAEAEHALDALIDTHLVAPLSYDTFQLHELLRSFGHALVEHGPAQDRPETTNAVDCPVGAPRSADGRAGLLYELDRRASPAV